VEGRAEGRGRGGRVPPLRVTSPAAPAGLFSPAPAVPSSPFPQPLPRFNPPPRSAHPVPSVPSPL
jgi:hypothetical protein